MSDVLLGGRYRLEDRLGGGGMGDVWRARDEFLHRGVAVKEVRLPAGLTPQQRAEFCERMMREARAAAALAHPSIITVHDVLSQDDRPWIVMDLINGSSLEQVRVERGPMPPKQVAEIGVQLLDALALAHRRGILHRDVKPANVLLTASGQAILTDFGIATIAGDERLTLTHGLIGSPGYMAPERLQQGSAVGPSSDLWSLAATLYAAVEGRSPFARPNAMAMLGAVLTEDAPVPVNAGPLGGVLLAMLARDPARRPDPRLVRQTFQAVAGDGTPAPAVLPPLPGRMPPHQGVPTIPSAPPRGPGRLLAVLAAGLLATCLAAGALLFKDDLFGGGPSSAATTPPPGSQDPGTAPSTAPVASAAQAPDPCGLLSAAEAARLTGTDAGSARPGLCTWGNVEIKVRFFPDKSGKPGSDQAKDAYALYRRQAVNDAGTSSDPVYVETTTPVKDLPGAGDAAFVQEKVGKGSFASATSLATLYAGRTLLQITYRVSDGSVVTPAQREATKNIAITAAGHLPQN
ncbi:serine/threonine-protein kinase [Actinocorallia longicatena]|uniref:non-specific serine/threonine protein kinase n=1 Tax=Actinocorallia longicatena TaxID=111803 RepID=A0ABP6QFY5_9ACTN